MSYFILPKNYANLHINITKMPNDLLPIDIPPLISSSLITHIAEVKLQIENIHLQHNNEYYNIVKLYIEKIINPYEFIYSNVIDTMLSVSKSRPFSNTFFIMTEIINTYNIFTDYCTDSPFISLHIGPNSSASIECFTGYKEGQHLDCFSELVDCNTINVLSLEISSYTNTNEYVAEFTSLLYYILYNQKCGGTSIIKIDTIYHKPILDIIYMLCNCYDKVYITKPNVCNVLSNDRYLVCKGFTNDIEKIRILINKIKQPNSDLGNVINLLDNELPCHFISKVEESNIIIGHQQLDAYDQIINIIKHKNISDKIELIKRTNIQKCIYWCEKYKIPYNKFNEKINIFLDGSI